MVGLDVVDDQNIQVAAVEDGVDVLKVLRADSPVSGVDQDGLLVQQDVGVVGDAVIQGMDILKQGKPTIVSADPVQIVSYFTIIVHMDHCLLVKLIMMQGKARGQVLD